MRAQGVSAPVLEQSPCLLALCCSFYSAPVGMCQSQRWPSFSLCARLLCATTLPHPSPHRAGWVELEEDDTIFKCVSVLQARAPTPLPGTSPPSASAGSARGHGLMEGLMGLKRWVGMMLSC